MQIPIIREEEASAEVGRVFADIKETLGVPVVSSFFQALAVYPKYLSLAWSQIKPQVGTAAFEGDAEGIRARSEGAARSFDISDHASGLRRLGWTDEQVLRVRQTMDTFHRTYPRLFLIATALKESMREQPVGTPSAGGEMERASRVDVPEIQPSALTMQCEANGRVGPIVEDIKRRLDLPFVNSVYLAMACWPDYLELAWDEARSIVGMEQYVDRMVELEVMANSGMADLPHPVKADPSALHAVGVDDNGIREIRELLETFAWVLDGTVLNVAIFRQGLKGGTAHLRRRSA
jgi:hypothetical protein